MNIVLWNTEWRKPTSTAGGYIQQFSHQCEADVICYSEVIEGLHPIDGEVIYSEADYGYQNTQGKRKVSLWSNSGWEEVDPVGSDKIPSGRFVSGVTRGGRFLGVCIPWRDAHVSTGRKDRTPWEDHLVYLTELKSVIHSYLNDSYPICLLGDYNQRVPQRYRPDEAYLALEEILEETFTLITAGIRDADDKLLIDHIALTSGLKGDIHRIHPKTTEDGVTLSDHVGIHAKIHFK